MLLFWLIGQTGFSQKKNAAYTVHIHHTRGPITIDGILDEPSWEQAEVCKDFAMILPMDTSQAHVKTEVRMMYDAGFLYLSAVCFDGIPGPYMVESLRRDFSFTKNDN